MKADSIIADTICVRESFSLGKDAVDASHLMGEGTAFLNIPVPAVPPTDVNHALIKDSYMLCVGIIFTPFKFKI